MSQRPCAAILWILFLVGGSFPMRTPISFIFQLRNNYSPMKILNLGVWEQTGRAKSGRSWDTVLTEGGLPYYRGTKRNSKEKIPQKMPLILS